MQEQSPSASHILLDFLKILAIPLAGGIGYLGSWLQSRKKLKPEITNLEANAEKTRAEARKLDSDIINAAHDRIDELVVVNFQLRQDCLKLQRQVDMAEIRDRFNDQQKRKLKALLDVHGIKYSECDEPKRQ